MSDTSEDLVIYAHSHTYNALLDLRCFPLNSILMGCLLRIHVFRDAENRSVQVHNTVREVNETPDDGQLCLVALAGDWSLLQEGPRPVTDCQLHSPSSKEQ